MTDREKAAYLVAIAAYDWNMAVFLAKDWVLPQDLLCEMADEVTDEIQTIRDKGMR